MSCYEFERLTPQEFGEIYKAYHRKQDLRRKESWEQLRIIATLLLQPHLKKGMTPRDILPLAWDKDELAGMKVQTREKQITRLKKLLKKG